MRIKTLPLLHPIYILYIYYIIRVRYAYTYTYAYTQQIISFNIMILTEIDIFLKFFVNNFLMKTE
jgi:hypothetical protein